MGKKTKVNKIDKETGKVVKRYESIRKAAEDNYTCVENISRALNGVYETSVGFKWEKIKEDK